jgi:hypothetical protein
MKRYCCFFLMIFYYFSGFSQCQNLVNNSGFELRKSGSHIKHPVGQGEVGFLSVWEDDIDSTQCNNINPNAKTLLYSPDWMLTNISYDNSGQGYQHYNIWDFHHPSGTLQKESAHSGNGFVGMRKCELIQQRLFDSNPIEEGIKYELKLFIKTTRHGGDWQNPNQGNFTVKLKKSCNLPFFRTGCKYTNVVLILNFCSGNGSKLC